MLQSVQTMPFLEMTGLASWILWAKKALGKLDSLAQDFPLKRSTLLALLEVLSTTYFEPLTSSILSEYICSLPSSPPEAWYSRSPEME